MRKLKIYRDGSRYFDGGLASIYPEGVEPIMEYDLSNLKQEEYERLLKKPRDKKLLKKAKRIKRKGKRYG